MKSVSACPAKTWQETEYQSLCTMKDSDTTVHMHVLPCSMIVQSILQFSVIKCSEDGPQNLKTLEGQRFLEPMAILEWGVFLKPLLMHEHFLQLRPGKLKIFEI